MLVLMKLLSPLLRQDRTKKAITELCSAILCQQLNKDKLS